MGVNKVVYGGETIVDLTEDTVTPEKMLSGTTAHNKSGDPISGNVIATEVIELTKAEYDALPSTKLTDGKHYLIKDYSEGDGSGSGSGGSQLNYSTEEQDTGIQWFDGRHIFQKSYIFNKPQVQFFNDGRADLILMDWDVVDLCWVKESIFKIADSYMNLIYPAADSSGRLVASTRLVKVNGKLVLRFFGGEYWGSYDGRYLYLTIHYIKK